MSGRATTLSFGAAGNVMFNLAADDDDLVTYAFFFLLFPETLS